MNEKFKPLVIITMALVLFVSCKHEEKEIVDHDNSVVVKSHLADTIASATTTRNWLRPPYKYWGIKNVDKLFDIGAITKGPTTSDIELDLRLFEDLKIEQFDGEVYTFDEHLDSNRTDGFLVLHKGKVIFEKYYGNMMKASSHNWFSMSKSMTGLTASLLAAEGLIDLQKQTLFYLPELKGSAWEGTTVQMVMDMLVGIEYNEAYDDPKSDAYRFAKISEFVDVPGPPSEFATMLDYMKTVKKGRNHNELFHYVSLNTEILGIIISKVTGKQPSEVMSEKIWSKIGAEQDAYVMRNSKGYELVSAAINTCLRDAGRFGQLVLDDGYYNGKQIVPKSVIYKIKTGGSVEKFANSKRGKVFKNFHYTDQWWHTDKEAFFAKGLFGQWIYIDPSTELVVVKFTTSDIPTSTEYDWINNMNLMNAIVKHFK
tara:strand:+ start:238 stop:1518 length:1281 start_codon:yes stop_codon:yes gene_type:complete